MTIGNVKYLLFIILIVIILIVIIGRLLFGSHGSLFLWLQGNRGSITNYNTSLTTSKMSSLKLTGKVRSTRRKWIMNYIHPLPNLSVPPPPLRCRHPPPHHCPQVEGEPPSSQLASWQICPQPFSLPAASTDMWR